MSFSLVNGLPEIERKMLEEEAARDGQEPDALLISLVGEALLRRRSASDAATTSPDGIPVADTGMGADIHDDDDLAGRFRRWADGQPHRGVPVIPLEALDREHIYEDHA